jgi:hypothetical protein
VSSADSANAMSTHGLESRRREGGGKSNVSERHAGHSISRSTDMISCKEGTGARRQPSRAHACYCRRAKLTAGYIHGT